MCINPSKIWVERGPNWEQLPVPCKSCWRCKQNRVNDYVARSMAEASTSKFTCCVSMTYADRSDLADKVLHPRHFQLFMKLLRRAGHKVRYLVSGEYGELKGRAHFHALLFFTHIENRGQTAFYNEGHIEDPETSAPFSREIPHKRTVHVREWPHGHIKCDWTATEQAARYVCKYLLADDKNNAWFSLSKKPPLGAAWFAKKAALAVEHGVMPSSFDYLPPGGNKDRPYIMTGATRRDYLNAITQSADKRENLSEWVQKSFDKHHLKRVLETWSVDTPPDDLSTSAADWHFLNNIGHDKPDMLVIHQHFFRKEIRPMLKAGLQTRGKTPEERQRYDTWLTEIFRLYYAKHYPHGSVGVGRQLISGEVNLPRSTSKSRAIADASKHRLPKARSA